MTLRENECHVWGKYSLKYFCDVSVCHLIFFNVTLVERVVEDDWRNVTVFNSVNYDESERRRGYDNVLEGEEYAASRMWKSEEQESRHALENSDLSDGVLPRRHRQQHSTFYQLREGFLRLYGGLLLKLFAAPQLAPPSHATSLTAEEALSDESSSGDGPKFIDIIVSTTTDNFETMDTLYQVDHTYNCFYDPNDMQKIVFSRPGELWVNLLISVGFAVMLTVYMVGVPLFVIRKTAGWNNGTGYGTRMTQKMRSFFGIYSRYRYFDQ